jgi:predicted Fe-Mo cluster-binding NifX family protein
VYLLGGKDMVRIVIPVEDEKGESLSEHFGRAPYFAWYELEDGKIVDKGIVPNDSEHFGGIGVPPDRILQLRPYAVITFGMGPRALSRFQSERVAVLQAVSSRVEEDLNGFLKGDLKELTEGCLHAQHR